MPAHLTSASDPWLAATAGVPVLLALLVALATLASILMRRGARARRATADELDATLATLERQRGELAVSRAELAELRRTLVAKDESVANTVHELRTPLTSIMASLDILQTAQASNDADRAEFLEQGIVACRHLMFLLNDLLDHAAFEAGRLRMEIRDHEVIDLLGDAVQIMKPWALARGLALQVEVPHGNPVVRGDRARVLQVIVNLLSNAMKFSPPSEKVTLRAVARPSAIAFEIEDRGMGVPRESRDKLFTRFGRAHGPEANAPKGTGLGLYMARVLVEQMQGCIGHRERDGGPGAVFWFTLPLATRSAAAMLDTADAQR